LSRACGPGVEQRILRFAIAGLFGQVEKVVLDAVEHSGEGSGHALDGEVPAVGDHLRRLLPRQAAPG
jgi:hypothetical protein